MQRIFPLSCILICLLLASIPAAGAVCNRTYPINTIPPAPGPDGTISVETSPAGAEIYINGMDAGAAPVSKFGFWPGTYTVTAKLAGYQDYTMKTTITGPFLDSIYCKLVPDITGNGIYVISTPSGADVYLDGTLKGSSPLMIHDPGDGSHDLVLRLAGFSDWRKSILVPSSGTVTATADLLATDSIPGQGLNITSDPSGATVLLDGSAKGITPVVLHTISPGIHILELQYSGYNSWKSTVDVPETTIRDLQVSLVPDAATAPGRIRVTSDPGDSSLMIDGTYTGMIPEGECLNLDAKPPGEYTLVISHTGYRPYITRVVVTPGNVSDVTATLVTVLGTPARGNLSVSTSPAGASVLVDNETIGISPVSDYQMTAGDHHVSVFLNGYAGYASDVHIPADESSVISVSLQKETSPVYSPASLITLAGALAIALGLIRKTRL